MDVKLKTKPFLTQQEGIAILAFSGILLHLILRFFFSSLQDYANYPLYFTLFFGGIPLIYNLLKELLSLNFGSDLIAGISIITSILLQEYLAGSLVVLMLSGGEAIENYAIQKASRVLEALAKRAPTIAHRKANHGSNGQIDDITVDAINVGDTLIIFPHEICPADGVVVEGNGVMDESYLTGEPFMMEKAPGSGVISGAINGEDSLTIKASKRAVDSRYSQIIRVMSETEQKRPYIRRLADQLGAWYTPIALFIALAAWYFSSDPVRFLAVLVIATPCPLLIAIPVAIIGSISLAASRGILIKNPAVLEQIDQCKTMIFDKTGTLTYGAPELTEQITFSEKDPDEMLKYVASIERYSKHPLAHAILEKAHDKKLVLLDASSIREEKGKGLTGLVDGHEITITSRKIVKQMGLEDPKNQLPGGAGLECVVLIDGQLGGYFRFRDSPRTDSKPFITHLAPMHGIHRAMIVSGDRREEVQYLADSVGITEVYAEKSPEEKVDIVVEATKKEQTAYIGDGINDAPALIAATVGIAFGRNSDITAEAAGAVIMESSLEKVDEFIHISARMRTIALQSAVGGMALSVVGMLFAAYGHITPVAGAIGQEIIDVVAILNALRTIWRPGVLTDIKL